MHTVLDFQLANLKDPSIKSIACASSLLGQLRFGGRLNQLLLDQQSLIPMRPFLPPWV